MPATAIFCFVRTRRLAIVASGTRNARAISAVRQPAQRPQRQRDPRLDSASAGWQHVKISRSRSSAMPAVERVQVRRRRHRDAATPQLRGADPLPPDPVDRPVAGRRGQPGARLSGMPSRRQARQRRGERVLRALLGQVPVAGEPDERGDERAPVLRERVRQRPARRRRSRASPHRPDLDLPDTPPPGAPAAISIASSRSAQSTIARPPTCSRPSMNGPSVSSTSPSRTRTVVAVALSCRPTCASQHPAALQVGDPGVERAERSLAAIASARSPRRR